jgi:hypothetical protein
MSRLPSEYTIQEASAKLGAKGRDLILAHMRQVLGAVAPTSPRRRSGP